MFCWSRCGFVTPLGGPWRCSRGVQPSDQSRSRTAVTGLSGVFPGCCCVNMWPHCQRGHYLMLLSGQVGVFSVEPEGWCRGVRTNFTGVPSGTSTSHIRHATLLVVEHVSMPETKSAANALPTTCLAVTSTCVGRDIAAVMWHTPGEVHWVLSSENGLSWTSLNCLWQMILS